MTVPTYVREREDFWRSFKVGQRIRRKKDGSVYIIGNQANVHNCWLMRLSPAAKGHVSWKVLLDEFEACG